MTRGETPRPGLLLSPAPGRGFFVVQDGWPARSRGRHQVAHQFGHRLLALRLSSKDCALRGNRSCTISRGHLSRVSILEMQFEPRGARTQFELQRSQSQSPFLQSAVSSWQSASFYNHRCRSRFRVIFRSHGRLTRRGLRVLRPHFCERNQQAGTNCRLDD
jgi:hypothetical protein